MFGKVLVLNQDYTALSICSVSKAFLLIYMDKAETLSILEGQYIRSVSQKFQVPSVIRLKSYVRFPYRSGVVLNRQNLFKRDGHQCLYCGTTKNLTLDHVLPSSRGGRTSWENLATACKSCNSKKGDRTPEEANMTLKHKPFKPSFIVFLRSFSGIHEDWLEYLGGTRTKAR